MASPSGFVDFNSFYEANQPEEERLLEEAMTKAEAADADSRRALRRVTDDASGGGRRNPDGSLATGTADITQVGSYSDYLAAKRNAANAWRNVAGSSSDPRLNALHQSLRARNGVGAREAAAAEARVAREDAAGARARTEFEGLTDLSAREQARIAAERKAAEERQAGIDETRQQMLGSLGSPSDWQRTWFGPGGYQDAAQKAQLYLRLGGGRGDARVPRGWNSGEANESANPVSQRDIARQLAWGDNSLQPGQRFPTGGENAESIQNDRNFRLPWETEADFGY